MERPFAAYIGDDPHVFVSYAHSDAPVVYPEITWLKESGFNIWYDEGIEAGTEWTEALARAIKQAKLFLYFVTPESAQSRNCRNEVSFALEQELPIVAVHLQKTNLPDGLSLTLATRQAILKHEISQQEYEQKLKSRVAAYLDQEVSQPGPAEEEETVDVAAMRSIAVLPFTNMSTSEETGFVADGLSEDILDYLAKFDALKVASRSGSFQFTGRGVDPAEVGDRLGVSYLLEGSVRQRGDTLRITAQLIRAKDGSHIWSKTYERPAADDFSAAVATNIAYIAESELAHDILTNYERKQSEVFAAIDPVAVSYFLHARNEDRLINLGEGGNLNTRIQFLKNAIEVDPSFLRAHMMLAQASHEGHAAGAMSLETARATAHAAIDSALQLAPDDGGVYYQLAQIHLWLDLDYAQSATFWEQQLVRAPQGAWPHYFLASIDLREGRTSDARRRLVNVGDSANTHFQAHERAALLVAMSVLQNVAGDYERALAGASEALKLAPAHVASWAVPSQSLIMLGRVEEARRLIEEAWRLIGSTGAASFFALFAYIGEAGRARDILTDSRYDLRSPCLLAMGHLTLGDIDECFRSINSGIEQHDLSLLDSLIVAEWWDPIRDDPRFDEMLARLDSKVTHTDRYLRDHGITQSDQ